MSPAVITVAFTLIGLGIVLALGYLLSGRARLYLLLLGLVFVISGTGTLLGGMISILFFFIAGVLLVLAFLAGVQDTRERWIEMQAEAHDREGAFGEYLAETTRRDVEEENAKKAEQSE